MKLLPVPRTAATIATLVGGTLAGPDRLVAAVAGIDEADAESLVFLDHGAAPEGAGVLLCRAPWAGRTCILVADPLAAMVVLLSDAFPEWRPTRDAPSVHPDARVHATAVLYPGVVVGPNVEIGRDSILFPNVVLYPGTHIGDRVRIHAGAVIGGDGFRYHPTASGPLKVPHVAGVRIENDAEIGANTTVDRGLFVDTRIGRGAKIDNLVQIGHNCDVGDYVIIVSQTGLSGSVNVGAGAIIAGQVGIADHRSIGAGARLGARSAVHTDIPAGETWLGEPARPAREAMRVYAALKYLPELVRKLGS